MEPRPALPRTRIAFQSTVAPGFLSYDECHATIAAGLAELNVPARVQSGYARYREGKVAWFLRASPMEWLFDRIEDHAAQYALTYDIDVDGLCDSMQFVTYEVGGHFHWHTDVGNADAIRRKITVCVQLSSANSYEGGNLEFVGEPPVLRRRAKGSATAFSSLLGHRLSAVTSGTRYALVAWMLGPPYR
jgi:PKHD-type hydroxylase